LSWPKSKPGFNDGLVWQPFSGETTLEKLKLPKAMTKTFAAGFTLAACVMLGQGDTAVAASKSQRCETYAHNAARSAPTRGGPARGALVGAGIGSFSASAGAGAAIGAGVGATRRVAQRSRAYRYYYDRCMGR
jgi:hypothetical protein